jgi:hypothetical protein
VPLAWRYPEQPKLDRLAHNVAFISNLMESGIEFTAADFPRLSMHGLRWSARGDERPRCVDLTIIKRPPDTRVHLLEGRPDCRKCRKAHRIRSAFLDSLLNGDDTTPQRTDDRETYDLFVAAHHMV